MHPWGSLFFPIVATVDCRHHDRRRSVKYETSLLLFVLLVVPTVPLAVPTVPLAVPAAPLALAFVLA